MEIPKVYNIETKYYKVYMTTLPPYKICVEWKNQYQVLAKKFETRDSDLALRHIEKTMETIEKREELNKSFVEEIKEKDLAIVGS